MEDIISNKNFSLTYSYFTSIREKIIRPKFFLLSRQRRNPAHSRSEH